MSPTPVQSNPFPLLTEVPPERFAAELQALETGPLALLGSTYAVVQRRCYLAPNGTWVAYVGQADQAARTWKGERQAVPGRRVGIDLIELWRGSGGGRAEALCMTTQPVDGQDHFLLAHFTLSPRKA